MFHLKAWALIVRVRFPIQERRRLYPSEEGLTSITPVLRQSVHGFESEGRSRKTASTIPGPLCCSRQHRHMPPKGRVVPGMIGHGDVARAGRPRPGRPIDDPRPRRRAGHRHPACRPPGGPADRQGRRSGLRRGDWQYNGPYGPWAAALVRAPGATTADLYIEPYQIETGRTFEITLTYDDGSTAAIGLNGGAANPDLRMPADAVASQWLGQDGHDLTGRPRRRPRRHPGRPPGADATYPAAPPSRRSRSRVRPARRGCTALTPPWPTMPNWSWTPTTPRRPTSISAPSATWRPRP